MIKNKIHRQSEKNFFSYFKTIIISGGLAFLFLYFIAQPVMVFGNSMTPTLKNGETLITEKISKKHERFDIVTINVNNKKLIKRIIGIPGDIITIINGKVYINDEMLKDVISVEIIDAGIAKEPIKLKENEYFVMGDNRNDSSDSRKAEIGIVESEQIFGTIIFRFLPPKIF